MTALIDADPWPTILTTERLLTWRPDWQNEHSPPTLGGIVQVRNNNGGGLWRCTFQAVQIRSQSEILAWKGLELQLQGGLEPIDVPWCGTRPWPLDSNGRPITSVPPGGFGDGFADTPIIRIKVTAACAARAVVVPVVIERGDLLLPGMHFARDHTAFFGWRLYGIFRALSTGGLAYNLHIWPPLRAPIAVNSILEFVSPKCVMRLASTGAMDVALEMRKRGEPDVEFVEADAPPESA